MRITQGTFYFPDLTDQEIRAQIEYALAKDGRAPSSTPTTRTSQRLLGDARDADVRRQGRGGRHAGAERLSQGLPGPLHQVERLRPTKGHRVDPASFIVNRPASEPAFHLVRQRDRGARSGTRRSRGRRGRARTTTDPAMSSPPSDTVDLQAPFRDADVDGSSRSSAASSSGPAREERIRDTAAYSPSKARVVAGPPTGASPSLHMSHGKSGDREDDRGHADGGDPPPARYSRKGHLVAVTRDDPWASTSATPRPRRRRC